MIGVSGGLPVFRAHARSIRRAALVGTAIGWSFALPVQAEKVVFNGNGDFSATRSDTLTDTAQVVDVRTTTGNLSLNFANLQATSSTNGSALFANVTTAGTIGVTTGIVNVTGANSTNGVNISGRGDITLVAGTTTANTNNIDRAINVTTPTGNITITSTQADGSLRGISTSDGTGAALPSGVTTINSGIATANGTGQINAILAQGATVIVNAGTTSHTNVGGNSGAAIFAQAGAGGATIKSTTVNLAGLNQAGIQANLQANGSVSIDSGTVNATQSATAIRTSTTGGSGTSTIKSATINIVGNSTGIQIDAGTGANNVDSGTIASSGNGVTGILVNGGTGASSIKSGTINLTGTNTLGISATGAAITIASTTVNASAGGILANGTGDIAVTSGAVSTTANGAYGIRTIDVNGNGATAITSTGTITTAGTTVSNNTQYSQANGIWATSGRGPVTIASNNITTTGEQTAAIFVESGSGVSTVTAPTNPGNGAVAITSTGTIKTSGGTAYGIQVQAGAGPVTITNSGAVQTTGFLGSGIVVIGPSAAIAIQNSNVQTAGDQAIGIVGNTTNGTLDINSATVTTAGKFAYGITAGSVNGAITVTSNNVTTSGQGADAITATETNRGGGGGGATTISGGGTTDLPPASTTFGTIKIVSNGTVSTAGLTARGIVADAGGAAATITNNGSVKTSGDAANGINVTNTTGATTVNSASVATTGATAFGINASSTTGAVAITSSTVTTAGVGAQGIFAQTTDGNITINAGTTKTTATAISGQNTSDAVFGYSSGNGAVTITSVNASTAAQNSSAVGAVGGGAISITSGIAATSGAQVSTVYGYGRNAAAVTINATTTSATGNGAYAVEGHAVGGALTLTSGTATTLNGIGVYGTAGGLATVSAASTSVGGDGQAGVYVNGGTGVVLTVGTASSTGALQTTNNVMRRADAVYADTASGGIAATIGTATATGANADAVHLVANGTGGAVTLNLTGAATAANGFGVFIDPPGSVAATIGAGGSATGSKAGLTTTSGGTNAIVNSGTIRGTAGVGIIASGATTLDNSGTIAGSGGVAVQLGATNDTVTLRTGSAVTGAIVGGGGTDTAILAGTSGTASAGQTVATFSGFTSLNVQSGYWTAPATGGSAFASATIASGASLEDVNGATGLVGVTAPSIVDNGTLVVRSSATSAGSTFGATQVTGSGAVLLTGAGTVRLDGTNSLANTGSTTIDGGTTAIITGTQGGALVTTTTGTLQVGTGGTTGAFTGSLTNTGTLVVNRSDDYTFTGAVSGDGTINKLGAGKLTFGTNFAFTGITNIVAGSVKLSTPVAATTELDVEGGGQLDLSGTAQTVAELAGNSGTASVNIAGGSLTVNQATSTSFAGNLTGNGSLNKTGSGRLNLTGVDTYTGPTTVSGGTLSVNGSIISPTTVTSGGTLGGTGTVASVTIASGGTYAPGNSIGTQTVNGNVTFQAGSTFLIEANAAGQADRINATGTATLAGAVRVLPDATGTYANLTNYTILTATGGVTGTFSSTSSSLAYLTPLLTYGTNAVTLTLARNDVSFAAIATDANQGGVAAAVQSRGLGNPLYNYALGQSAAGARAAFTSLSGEIHASLPTTLLIEGQEVGRVVRSRATVSGDGIGVWGQAMYGLIESASRQGVASSRTDRRGGIAGIDMGHDGLRFGAAAGYLASDLGLRGRASHADVDTKLVTAYAGWSRDALMLNGGIAYSWHDVSTRRSVSAGALGGLQTAKYDANTAQVFGEAAYAFTRGAATFAPFLGYSHLRTHRDGFTETGTAAALTVAGSTRSIDVLQAGMKLYGTAPLGSATLLPHVAISYQRYWGNTLGIENANFASAGTGFQVVGARTGKDAIRVEGGADIQLGNAFRLGGSAFGQTSGAIGEYGARASISYSF